MNLAVWSDVIFKNSCSNLHLLAMAACQALIWAGLVHLHIDLKREDIYWEECIGKIRSACMRKIGSEEELDALKGRHYAPIVDRLITINFADVNGSIMERYLLLRCSIQNALCLYLIRWLRLLFVFLVVIWFVSGPMANLNQTWFSAHQVMLLWAWLFYAIRLAQKQISIWRELERVQQSLLLPHHD